MRIKFTLATLLSFSLVLFGCSNLFLDIADKGFDKAVLYDAQRHFDKSEYASCISKITTDLSADYQARNDVKLLLAKCYTGSCGLDFLDMADRLDGGASNLYPIFMATMTGATATDVDQCTNAIDTIETINTDATQRDLETNLLMLFAGFSKMGALSAIHGDADVNGTADAGWQPCVDAEMPQADVNESVSAFAYATDALSALLASGQDVGGADVEALDTLCATISAIDPTYDICSQKDSATVTARQRIAMRCLMDGPDMGFSTLDYANLLLCIDHPGNGACQGP